ncbi:hypothetical protein, partial [Nocardioides sp. NPDC000441]|uniref:hypothetical protein n=1 Tax=Nocardioides sp. NPDC000441 TaxID=3154256 RepID=UPI00333495D8
MSFAAVLVYAVTALVAVIVALTYLKPHLLQSQEAGLPSKIHLYAGAAGLLVWVLFLASPSSFFLGGDIPGVIGLFGIWLAAIAGLYLLARRLKEQRAAASGHDDYGYDDDYDDYAEEYAEDGYGYDEAGYAEPGYDDYAEPDGRAGYADPRRPRGPDTATT